LCECVRQRRFDQQVSPRSRRSAEPLVPPIEIHGGAEREELT
jgi:hypothetical protein